MMARRNIALEIETGDVPTSKWFLERKAPDFSNRQQVPNIGKIEIDENAAMATLAGLLKLSQQRAAMAAGMEQAATLAVA